MYSFRSTQFGKSDSFYYAVLYATRHHLKNKKDVCQKKDKLKEDLGNLYHIILNLKENLKLDLDIQNFENQCHSVNEILSKNGLFLRVYRLIETFEYLIKQNSEKKTVLRELSNCVTEKFNRFNIDCVEFSKKLMQSFRPINIIYKPVKKCDHIVDCIFSKKLILIFKLLYSEGQIIQRSAAWQCHFFLNLYAEQDKFD